MEHTGIQEVTQGVSLAIRNGSEAPRSPAQSTLFAAPDKQSERGVSESSGSAIANQMRVILRQLKTSSA
jgi:hypothetical protein